MRRRDFLRAAPVGVLTGVASASAARAEDFGKLLEGVARQAIARELDPRNPGGLLARQDRGEVVAVRTADGWNLVAHRYRPAAPPPPGALPVILCHGLGYSASFWDLEPPCSLARYLAERGFDVWAVSLRGCGLSQKWVWKLEDAPVMIVGGMVRRATRNQVAPTGFATVEPRYANWTLDDHVTYDVPALVALVRQRTGAPAVAWVGHSMGGIVALGHLARYQNPGIGRLMTVGSQFTMPEGQLFGQFLAEMIQLRQRQLDAALRGEQLLAQTQQSIHNLFFNTQNVTREVYTALSGGWATDVPSIGVLQQYAGLATRGELLDARKQFRYAAGLRNVTVPVYLACGAGDQLAPPPVQQFLHANVGSTDKTLAVFGRAQGFAADAGHDDALVGLNSRAQVYPALERWLRGAQG